MATIKSGSWLGVGPAAPSAVLRLNEANILERPESGPEDSGEVRGGSSQRPETNALPRSVKGFLASERGARLANVIAPKGSQSGWRLPQAPIPASGQTSSSHPASTQLATEDSTSPPMSPLPANVSMKENYTESQQFDPSTLRTVSTRYRKRIFFVSDAEEADLTAVKAPSESQKFAPAIQTPVETTETDAPAKSPLTSSRLVDATAFSAAPPPPPPPSLPVVHKQPSPSEEPSRRRSPNEGAQEARETTVIDRAGSVEEECVRGDTTVTVGPAPEPIIQVDRGGSEYFGPSFEARSCEADELRSTASPALSDLGYDFHLECSPGREAPLFGDPPLSPPMTSEQPALASPLTPSLPPGERRSPIPAHRPSRMESRSSISRRDRTQAVRNSADEDRGHGFTFGSRDGSVLDGSRAESGSIRARQRPVKRTPAAKCPEREGHDLPHRMPRDEATWALIASTFKKAGIDMEVIVSKDSATRQPVIDVIVSKKKDIHARAEAEALARVKAQAKARAKAEAGFGAEVRAKGRSQQRVRPHSAGCYRYRTHSRSPARSPLAISDAFAEPQCRCVTGPQGRCVTRSQCRCVNRHACHRPRESPHKPADKADTSVVTTVKPHGAVDVCIRTQTVRRREPASHIVAVRCCHSNHASAGAPPNCSHTPASCTVQSDVRLCHTCGKSEQAIAHNRTSETF